MLWGFGDSVVRIKARWKRRTCANVAVAFVHGADISRVGVVVKDLLVIVSALRLC